MYLVKIALLILLVYHVEPHIWYPKGMYYINNTVQKWSFPLRTFLIIKNKFAVSNKKYSTLYCVNILICHNHGWEEGNKICNSCRSRIIYLSFSSAVSTPYTTLWTKYSKLKLCKLEICFFDHILKQLTLINKKLPNKTWGCT